MTTRLEVISSLDQGEFIEFTCDEAISEEVELHPSGQVLVDSDTQSFIYILDSNDEFVYVSFPKDHWGALKEMIDHSKGIKLKLSNHPALTLDGFKPELEYLIENIKGNANYGDEMVKSVESTFLQQEQAN